MRRRGGNRRGFTLVETLVALALAALLMGALGGVSLQTSRALEAARERNELAEEARFAMERMVRALGRTRLLLLPLADRPSSGSNESIHSAFAVALDATLDRDADGFADADNDRDGRSDEDWPGDTNADGRSGIRGLDDDGGGNIDEGGPSNASNDDESPQTNEDDVDGIDNDGDGGVDEDPSADMNDDDCPGRCGIDDDGDALVDEGDEDDDDEDGSQDEDWIDAHVFFLGGATLFERLPDLDPSDGTDYTEHPLAEDVSLFRVERLAPGTARAQLVDLTLELTGDSGQIVSLHTRVRVGGDS
jgi:prepilin-type N-terminal cleavage/methylation domain-containing protein